MRPLIVGGKGVPQGQLPSLVLVAYLIPNDKGEAVVCTGTAISSRVVITAAHCVTPEKVRVEVENFRVLAGTTNRKAPGNRQLLVDAYQVFPGYQAGNGAGDVALVHLAEPSGLPSMELAQRRFWSGPTGAKMAGWGVITPHQRTATYVLHRADTVVRPRDWCRREGVRDVFLCTSGSERIHSSACYGDSGGPLLMRQPWDRRLVVAGILRGGSSGGCNRFRGINFYTPSYRVVPWVRRELAHF